jgi:predicted outer membrane repeat protein
VVEGFNIFTSVPMHGGMSLVSTANVRVSNCRFVDLDTGRSSGAGLFANGSTILVEDCEFIRCVASFEGGGLKVLNGRGTIRRCTFEECGPTAVLAEGNLSTLIESCDFRNNFGVGGGAGVALLGVDEAEVRDCFFEGNTARYGGGMSLCCAGLPYEITGNLFVSNTAEVRGGALAANTNSVVTGNTFVSNVAPDGGAVQVNPSAGSVVFERNVLAHNTGAPALESDGDPHSGDCNVFWSNAAGDYTDYTPGPRDRVADPEFCDMPGGDYTVRNTSPCAPANSLGCGQIGALGVGCGVIAVEPGSWGEIKSWHR